MEMVESQGEYRRKRGGKLSRIGHLDDTEQGTPSQCKYIANLKIGEQKRKAASKNKVHEGAATKSALCFFEQFLNNRTAREAFPRKGEKQKGGR